APELALARWLYGAYLTREGLLDEGLKELQAARDLEPENAEITYELGVALALEGNHEGAADEFFRATELAGDDGWTRVVLGLALLEDGREDEALADLAAGARSRPSDVEAQLLASLAAAVQGHDDLAWEMLERARQVGVDADQVLAAEVEERLSRGPEAARAFLRTELAPAAYRERLRERP
ncbi:MAG TPA: tetratricopeptide repeat protein, partial [Longimicrobiales bacterium]|nr:tetratricopeptide repeat protein [Longimicrobiales bacterium]